nr:MAG TPA: hypothetical protein [Caudoviricetes sp.]
MALLYLVNRFPKRIFRGYWYWLNIMGLLWLSKRIKVFLSTNSTRPSSNWPGWSITLHRRWQTLKRNLWEANVVSYAYIVMKKWKKK